MEVSSYQLEDSAAFRPDIAAILNVTPDHLEHHGSWEKYLKAKSRIFANQTPRDYCVFNRDDSACRSLSAAARSRKVFFSARREFAAEGVYYDKGEFVFHIGSRREKTRVKLGIPGAHNTSNALAAFAVARLAGAPVRAIKSAAQRFKGVEHRMETVARRNGVLYINDSKATNVSSTEVALAALDPGIWLILGGRDKGSPYKPLIPSIRAKVKGIFAIGEASLKISRELSPAVAVRQSGDLKTAVAAAARMASPGDTVLLSPACSSYDQFDNFERRGETFKKLVRSMGARL